MKALGPNLEDVQWKKSSGLQTECVAHVLSLVLSATSQLRPGFFLWWANQTMSRLLDRLSLLRSWNCVHPARRADSQQQQQQQQQQTKLS